MAATDKLNAYATQIYESLVKNSPSMTYTPRSESQLRDNLEAAYKGSYDQSVANRMRTTRQNRAAIDADAAARGMGASTWVTDAKMRQGDREATDLSMLAANKRSTIAQQLASAMSAQEEKNLSVNQFNAQIKANALNNALSAAGSMYGTFKAEEQAAAGGGYGGGGGSSGGGYNPYYKGGNAADGNATDAGFGSGWTVTNLTGQKKGGEIYNTGGKIYQNAEKKKTIVTTKGH